MDRGTTVLSRQDTTLNALTAAYDLYSVGLYDYCSWALGDNRLAEDAVCHALLAAAARGLLPRDPSAADPVQAETLRAWIFAAGRNETLRGRADAIRIRSMFAGSGAEWRALVQHRPSRDELIRLTRLRQTLNSLPTDEQELAELAFRHGFSPRALAELLGRPLALVRRSVAGVYAQLSDVCDDRVAATFAVAPFQGPPIQLRGRVLDAATIPAVLADAADRQAPYDRHGFPRPGDRRRNRSTVFVASATAAAALLAAAFVADTVLDQPVHRSDALLLNPAVTEPGPLAPALVLPDPPAPSPSPAPPPRRSPVTVVPVRPPARPDPAPAAAPPVIPPAPAPSVHAEIAFAVDLSNRTWIATVRATVQGATATSARITVRWTDRDGTHRRTVRATQTGDNTYQARIRGLKYGPVACARAAVLTTDGTTISSPLASSGGYGYCGSPALGRP
ncbi:MAG: sigma-70 family polymerase sigma factor [Actinomycetia bacterium]|nr:sigma-70 family polymerase sigma factor [Actinomycetes bacterium]